MTDFFDGSAFKAKVALEALKEEQRLLEFGLGFEVYLSLETAIKESAYINPMRRSPGPTASLP